MTPDALATALDQAAEPISLTGADGTLLYANAAFARMSGRPADQLLGRPADAALGIDRTPAGIRRDLERTLSRGRPWRGELTGTRANGASFSWQASITPVLDEAGAVRGFLSICQDAMSRQDLEARLRQSQKMEAIGQLAGGIAHDFNNLLTVIGGYSEQLVAGLGGQPRLQRAADAIRGAASRASGLTRQLLAFSRRQILAPRPLDLNAVVTDMSKLLRRLIGEDIRLVLRLAPGRARVEADPSQIEQVVMNLAINARDAMPGGGTLTIETAVVEVDTEFAAARAGLVPGRYVMLSVEDDGRGMDAETMAHLFEPFFTTKAVGEGTGLGLSTIYGIVKQSGGYIHARSEPGLGTRFTVSLPCLEGAEEPAPADRPTGAPMGGSETLLVVEDEDDVRRFACDTLRACGYLVLEAAGGTAALRAAELHPGPIDLLVSDVVMPQMNGWEVAERVGRIRPDAKILFMSGHAEHPALDRRASAPAVPLLAKPFMAEGLALAVRRALDGSASEA